MPQLGFAPGHNQRFETPDQCHPMRVPLLKDDVIVFASDGLYDNVFESDILQIVQKWTKDMVGNSDRAITAGEARILADLLVDAVSFHVVCRRCYGVVSVCGLVGSSGVVEPVERIAFQHSCEGKRHSVERWPAR